MSWLLWAFLSAALLGFYDISKKVSLRGNAVLPVLLVNTWACSALMVMIVLFSCASGYNGLSWGTWQMHLYVGGKSCIVLASWICGYYAIKYLPLTLVGPVNATRPVLTLVGAMLLFGERLNAWQWAGVGLALLSLFLLSRNGRKEGVRFTHNRWVMLLALAAVLGAASGLYDKHLLASPHDGGVGLPSLFVQLWYNVYQAVLMTVVVSWLWRKQGKDGQTFSFQWRWSILAVSFFLTAADLVYFHALSCAGAMVSVVSMVRRGSVLVSFLFGALALHEKNPWRKSLDLIFILAGMVCLYIGSH